MADWPTSPSPTNTIPLSPIDPILSLSFDQGYESTRSRYSKPKRIFQVEYNGLTRTQLLTLYTFIRDTLRGQATTFTWTFPLSETISSVASGTPITVTTSNAHGFKNGDTIIIAGNSNGDANGTFLISNVTSTTFTLDGSSSLSSGTGGTATRKFLKMKLDGTEEALYELQKLIGPFSNNDSYWSINFIFKEVF